MGKVAELNADMTKVELEIRSCQAREALERAKVPEGLPPGHGSAARITTG